MSKTYFNLRAKVFLIIYSFLNQGTNFLILTFINYFRRVVSHMSLQNKFELRLESPFKYV